MSLTRISLLLTQTLSFAANAEFWRWRVSSHCQPLSLARISFAANAEFFTANTDFIICRWRGILTLVRFFSLPSSIASADFFCRWRGILTLARFCLRRPAYSAGPKQVTDLHLNHDYIVGYISQSEPLVEGIPFSRGSNSTAIRRARPKPLNTDSKMWCVSPEFKIRMCRFIPLVFEKARKNSPNKATSRSLI